MTALILATGIFLLGVAIGEISGQASIARVSRCSRDDHQKCIALADPLLKDPHLIFPDNMRDIDMVCRTWSNFVDCTKQYIDNCFSKRRQEQFNAAVEVPIASVHQMCSVSTYQAEYLQYASCLKATVIESEHCGNQYAALVDEVSKGEMARTSLCCSHYHFRSCVIYETKKKCDANQSGGAASRFSRQVLDKALSFLQDQCQNYIPNNADCPHAVTDPGSSLTVSPLEETRLNLQDNNKGRTYLRTLSPDNNAIQASNFHGTSANTAHPSQYKSTGRALNSYPTQHTESDIPDSRASPTRVSTDVNNAKIPTQPPPQTFSSPSPPASHSSSSSQSAPSPPLSSSSSSQSDLSPHSASASGTPSSTSSSVSPKAPTESEDKVILHETNRVPMESNEEPAVVVTQRPSNYGRGMSWTSPATKPSTEIPAWATSTWLTSNQAPVTDESWYPAAGSFGGNHIDEPNQQGLSKNGQASLRSELLYLGVLSILVYLC
ncbi:uncharacterized protein DDB_G0271670-like isoform X1 [Venturia canescens]|uniref:uncharacterized protein DDB_G0271670-like isoform X1 n=1 Tax=Venturia canescens TaxID=32260 RepID=UPI001C9C9ADD|nr:uncharacterized protein DDB_G0271670-like isoform X1 [Venturia canescens]XP_043285907.1 uncharacterized protein DDB_G0271670-like isoform X1 [Venturia canescens]